MKKSSDWVVVLVLPVALVMAGSAFATNGYFTHGIGTKNKGMAGSGIAMPEDAIDIANNPAVSVAVGNHLVVGAALFSPTRKYQTSSSQLNGQFGAFTIGPNRLAIPSCSSSRTPRGPGRWAMTALGDWRSTGAAV